MDLSVPSPQNRRRIPRFTVAEAEAKVGKTFTIILGLHAAASFLMAFWYGTFAEAMIIGLPAWLVPAFLIKKTPNATLTKASVGAALMIYSGLYIHQARGMTELHFHVFASMAFLLAYRDWRSVLAAAVTIAVHHVSFAWLSYAGAPVFIYSTKASYLLLTVVHALFVVFEAAVLIMMSISGRKEWVYAEDMGRIGAALRGMSSEALDKHMPQSDDKVLDYVLNHLIDRLDNNLALGDQVRAGGVAIEESATVLLENVSTLEDKTGRLADSARLNRSLADEQAENVRQLHSTFSDLVGRLGAVSASSSEQQAQVSEAQTSLGHVRTASGTTFELITTADKQTAEAQAKTETTLVELAQRLSTTSETVGSLTSLASEIHGFVTVIEEIAEQTNLLALNAAIEAARAGESGRGFAVVADEVRKLAERSAESSREVSQIVQRMITQINASTATIEGGKNDVGLKSRTEDAMREFVAILTDLRGRFSEVKSGSGEVQAAVEQLTAMIGGIHQAASSNLELTLGLDGLSAQAQQSLAETTELAAKFERSADETVHLTNEALESLKELAEVGTKTERTVEEVRESIDTQQTDLRGLKQGFEYALHQDQEDRKASISVVNGGGSGSYQSAA